MLGATNNKPYKEKYEIEKISMSGFIAQEVEQAAQQAKYDFSGIDYPKTKGGLYGLRYADFVVPLVKAMQEQQNTIEQQQVTIDTQNKKINELASELYVIKRKLGIDK